MRLEKVMEHVSQSATAETAMTEIALALAMGFFAIMVLTMVSMGAGQPAKPQEPRSVSAARLAANASADPTAATTDVTAEDQLILFYEGRFLNPDLTPADIGNLASGGRVILAVPPDLPLSEAIELRGRIVRDDLIVSTLDDQWLATLKSRSMEKEDVQ